MHKDKDTQVSIFSYLYNNIPQNHILRLLKDKLDFSFITSVLEDSPSKYYGRPDKEPELLMKLIVLQYIYNLSDEQVMEEASLNLACMYFLDLNPEDELAHSSLLAMLKKFRNEKLEGGLTVDEVVIGILRQCVEKGILEGSELRIYNTHPEANASNNATERVIEDVAKHIFRD
ncbi:transposase [Metabacillus lacus]|nr:transposase [Metabacillus lacus]